MKRKGLHHQRLVRAREHFARGEYQTSKSVLLRLLEKSALANELRAQVLEQLALIALRCYDFRLAMQHLLRANQLDSSSLQTAWRLTLLTSLCRQLGLKRERFQLDCRRMLTLRKLALCDPEVTNRIYALSELVQELEDRDLPEEAAKYAQILRYYREQASA